VARNGPRRKEERSRKAGGCGEEGRGANNNQGEIEQMQRKSFKSGIENLVRETRAEAKKFAAILGLKTNRRLPDAIDAEHNYWCMGRGVDELREINLANATPEELRVQCLCAIELCLNPLGDLGACDLDELETMVDEYMNLLRGCAHKSAPPPSAKELIAWTAEYKKERAANERIRQLEEQIRALKREAAQAKSSQVRAVKAAATPLRLVLAA
jgi:hypothetical protein